MTAAQRLSRVLVPVCLVALAVVCGASAPARSATGTWEWPLQPAPQVARGFDPPSEPWLAGHRGVDLLGSPGQPVLAPASGVVRFAAALAGRGVVVLEVSSLRLTFEPVRASVSVGERVRAGGVLGHLTSVQSHCLPATCLHWGVKRGEGYLDPLSFVGDREIVLLPFGDVRDARSIRPGSGIPAAPVAPVAPASPGESGAGDVVSPPGRAAPATSDAKSGGLAKAQTPASPPLSGSPVWLPGAGVAAMGAAAAGLAWRRRRARL